MAKDPAFLFYTSDFLSGVVDLTMEERGQYITLLCLQHQKGFLNEKTIRLCVGSVSVDVMSKFKQSEDGNYYNERLLEEVEKRKFFIDSRRENGLKGGRPKASVKPNGYPNVEANDYPNGKPSENLPENKDDNKDDKEDKKGFSKKPTKDEFLKYCEERCATQGLRFFQHKSKASVKYDAWDANGWKDLNGNKISNWKAKIVANLQYWKDEGVKMQPSVSGNNEIPEQFTYQNEK